MSVTASVIIAMEGMPKAAFHMAQALAAQPKGGLTPSTLFRMVPLSMEDLDHFLDAYPRLFYMDINRVKITTEALRAVERVLQGMNGGRAALEHVTHTLERMDSREKDRFAHMLGLDSGTNKRSLIVDRFIHHVYQYPDSVKHWVESAHFSKAARQVFRLLWDQPAGEIEAARLRKASGMDEFRAEQTLWELLQNLVCFECFDFDDNDLLRRKIVLLEQIRAFRWAANSNREHALTATRTPPQVFRHGNHCVHLLARAACAAGQRPLTRNRNGQLSAASLRGIKRFTDDDLDPAYLLELLEIGIALGYLRQEEDGSILPGTRLALWTDHSVEAIHTSLLRHLLFERYPEVSRHLASLTSVIQPDQWYPLRNVIHAATTLPSQTSPTIQYRNGQYRYGNCEDPAPARKLLTLLQETFHWFGIVDLGGVSDSMLIRLTPLGHALLQGTDTPAYPLEDHPPSELIVKPDLEIFVPLEETPPQVLPVLSVYAEVSGVSDHNLLFRLTREKYLAAMQRGYPSDVLTGFLEQHTRNQHLPDNVRRTLEDWSRTPRRIRIRKVLQLECDDPVILAELSSYPELKPHLNTPDPAHTRTLQGLLTAEVRELLWRKGFIIE